MGWSWEALAMALSGLAVAGAPAGREEPGLACFAERVHPEQAPLENDEDLLAERGTIWGLVHAIHLGEGWLRLSSGQQSLLLHGSPEQLIDYKPGDQGEFELANHGGVLWLSFRETHRLRQFPSAFRGSTSGVLSGLDASGGRLRVIGPTGKEQVYRVHPARLGRLLPGAFVRVGYARIGGASWVRSVSPRASPPDARVIQK